MADNNPKSYLGVGWGFPPTFEQGEVGMVAAEEDISQSLEILMGTTLGERVMRFDYGSNLRNLLFEPLTNTLKTRIRGIVETAILKYEPRIKVNQIDLQQEDEFLGMVELTIEYTIISINSRQNFVYPFYLKEGTHLQP